jgi:hypothetical protein
MSQPTESIANRLGEPLKFNVTPLSSTLNALRSDAVVRLVDEAEAKVGERWRQRIVHHLANRRNAELRAGLAPCPPSDEDAIRSLLKQIGCDVDSAAQALEAAAQRLLKLGDGYGARLTHEAAVCAKRQADGLLGRVE